MMSRDLSHDLELATDAAAPNLGDDAALVAPRHTSTGRTGGQRIESAPETGSGFFAAMNAGIHRGAGDGPVDVGAAVAPATGGARLPADLENQFSTSLGADLSHVRVHTGAESARSAESLAARAYAVGSDIHFGAGQFDPASQDGRLLIAHEVAHTVQHAGGMRMKSTLSQPHDAIEVEADRAAAAMVSGLRTTIAHASSTVDRWVDSARASWAIGFITTAPPDLAPTLLQQLRAARGTRAPQASGTPVQLTLGTPGHAHGTRSGTVLYEDLEELLELARTASRPADPHAPVSPQHTDHPNAAGHPQPTTTDREPQGGLQPPHPTGVEGTPDQARYDRIVAAVRADLAAWTAYRTRLDGPHPNLTSPGLAWNSPERRQGISGAQIQYLQRAIGTNNVELLREMTSMVYTSAGMALAEMFGTTAVPYPHTVYRLRLDGDTATITFSNQFGLHYSHQFTLHGRSRSTGRSYGSHVLVGEDHSPAFYPATRFNEGYLIMNAQLGGAGGHLGSIRFQHGQQFMLYPESGTSAGATLSVGAGYASDAGHHEVQADPPRPGRTHDPVPGGQTLIYRTNVYFDTGSAELHDGGDSGLAATIRHIDQYRIAHPDAPIEIHITGQASPRWRGANASQADRNNYDLAERRTHAVQWQLANAQSSHTAGGRCNFRTTTCPASPEILIDNNTHDVDGSATARDAGVTRREDPPEWRRVEVLVYGVEYHQHPVQRDPQPPIAP